MISTKQPSPKPQNDNYARLANYIADASHEGQKCLMAWSAGCMAGDDFQLGISEVLATQACNTRTKKEKTYHLIVSFRPEDEAKLSGEDFKEIEQRFAKVLGFEEHQRHCGVHNNTANPHMHVAYNMIHPEKKIRHAPYYDYWKRDELCRKLEKEYGVSIDPGRKQRKELHCYLTDRKVKILPAVKAAQSWEHVHATMALYGLQVSCKDDVQFTPFEGAGRDCRVAGAEINSLLSKIALEERLGAFEPKQKFYQTMEVFEPSPLDKSKKNDKAETMEAYTGQESFDGYLKRHKGIIDAVRDSARSWKDFQNILQDELNVTIKERGRGAVFADLTVRGKNQPHAKLSSLGREYSRSKLEAEFGKLIPLEQGRKVTPKREYSSKPLHRDPERVRLLQEYKASIAKRKAMFEQQKSEREVEMQKLRLQWQVRIKKYRVDGVLTWKEKRYLISVAKAEQLRHEEQLKKKYAEKRSKIKEEIPYGNWNEFLRQKAESGNNVALAVLQSSKNKDQAVFKERPVEKLLEGMTYSVDNKGNITYKLTEGGVVLDNGKDIVASKDDEAQKFAQKLRGRRFGRMVRNQ
ncbi:TraI/MobA(P) family conjugative relaxase [Halodesulfovibrio spirochaetisodalis]|uniref:TraI/MobA(P) family conjugative relaxase n=1 Tax=Halodesulfovibrio spirochaetisodalis TaxID=1560234 RepID=UPI000836698D|nr:TraI/MobA(P) family conjugative relaxase [Halodesulfovibrio spirochaetisodalis]